MVLSLVRHLATRVRFALDEILMAFKCCPALLKGRAMLRDLPSRLACMAGAESTLAQPTPRFAMRELSLAFSTGVYLRSQDGAMRLGARPRLALSLVASPTPIRRHKYRNPFAQVWVS